MTDKTKSKKKAPARKAANRKAASKAAPGKKAGDFYHKQVDVSLQYAEILRRHIDDPDILQQLGTFQRRMFATRALGHWEVFKMIAELPGDIIECGVYKGESLFNWARFLETLCPGDRVKRVIGFDDFEGLRNLGAKDGYDPSVGSMEGGYRAKGFYTTLVELIELFTRDSFVPAKSRIHLVEGDLTKTAKDFVKKEPGLRINLLHLDVDAYAPTLAALEAFYPKVVTGGVVLLDEYAIPAFAGESNALDDYFDGKPPRIRKFPWLSAPGGYFVKE